MKTRLILASSSPYRQQILKKICANFSSFNPNIDESPLINETAPELVRRLAQNKAMAYASNDNEKALVIGSDQMCVINDKILGKPGNFDKAKAQLMAASGNVVRFYTGLALYNTQTKQCESLVEHFDVHFRELPISLIEAYLQHEQPYDCAGSFKSEGAGIVLFSALQGRDPNTLIGLPLMALVELLEKNGWSAFRENEDKPSVFS